MYLCVFVTTYNVKGAKKVVGLNVKKEEVIIRIKKCLHCCGNQGRLQPAWVLGDGLRCADNVCILIFYYNDLTGMGS